MTLTLACVLLGFIAAMPDAATAILAPGLDLSARDGLAIRLFALTGIALLGLWRLAGERQRAADFAGLAVIAIVPNAALIAGALTRSLIGIGAAMLAAAVLAGVVLSVRGVRGGAGARAASVAGASISMLDLVVLSLATQLNLVLVRVAAGDLAEGSVGALFIAVGVVTLPVIAVAGSAAAVSLPHWRAAAPSRPLREALHVAALASAAAAVVLGGLAFLDAVRQSARRSIPPCAMLCEPPCRSWSWASR